MNEPLEQLLRTTFQEDADRMLHTGNLASSARIRLRRQRQRRWQVAGTGITVLVIAGSVGIMSVGGDRAAPPTAPTASASPTDLGPEPELVGTDWQLVEFTRNGISTTVPVEVDSGIWFYRDGQFRLKSCNSGSGNVVLEGRRIELSGGFETEILCGATENRIENVVRDTFRSGQLEGIIEQQRLVLRAGNGDTLVYGVHPARTGRAIIVGERGGFQYRVAVAELDYPYRLAIQRRPRPGPWRHTIGMTVEPLVDGGRMPEILSRPAGDENIVAGAVPNSAVRVVHRDPANAEDTELEILPIDGVWWHAFAGFVPDHTSDSTITAYDAAGQIVATWSTNR